MAGQRFGADMSHLFLGLLRAPRSTPDSLTEPDERIDDEGRARQTDDREASVVVDQHRQVANERQ